MFGMPCAKIGGKAFVGLYQDSLVVKIGRERVEKMLKAKTGRQFDPSGMGRPMKEWVAIEEPESGRPKKPKRSSPDQRLRCEPSPELTSSIEAFDLHTDRMPLNLYVTFMRDSVKATHCIEEDGGGDDTLTDVEDWIAGGYCAGGLRAVCPSSRRRCPCAD